MDVQTTLEYLTDSSKYNIEKPFLVYPAANDGWEADDPRLHNISWSERPVVIRDVRNKEPPAAETSGFQWIEHKTAFPKIVEEADMEGYMREVEGVLLNHFKADKVICYDCILRENRPLRNEAFDTNNKLSVDRPPRGAHDYTLESGVSMLKDMVPDNIKEEYFQGGYRFRIINLWRPLLAKCEDRPLAVCDFSSIDPEDLIAADRIYPHKRSEIFYLQYRPSHSWYWLSDQTPNEPVIMTMFDTKAGPHARYCPHVSFHNPLAPKNARPRESVETRSIVISAL